MTRPFRKILVANRGEIAIRVMRAATELGLRTVAIYSEEDRLALHRYKADESYLIGRGKSPLGAYLGIEEIVDLAVEKRCDAVHPGYGFLSENPDFPTACQDRGVAFVGPPAEVMAQAADKIAARRLAEAAGVACVPGLSEAVDAAAAREFATRVGYPVILKAAAGGGGRGIRVCRTPDEIDQRLAEAKREATAAFGRGDVYVERFVERPKHIEIQILGDAYANVVHLFERDCSVQRRHQKLIEIAPATALPEGVRSAMADAAVRIVREAEYQNAGTVEFLYDPESVKFFFVEVNARIQVEHTVTEAVTGIDLVKAQIRIAEGARLDHPDIGIADQAAIEPRGVAIQCRITTEDPANDFLPDYGRITTYRSAVGHGIRLDAGTAFSGAVILPYYDSLLVKVTAWGRGMEEAATRMQRTLAEFRVRGVKTNIPFLQNVLRHPEFLSGDSRTDFVESHPDVLRFARTRDRANRLLGFLGEVTINGNPLVKGAPKPEGLSMPRTPEVRPDPGDRVVGTRRILAERGPEGLAVWMAEQRRLLITDTTFRDAHQSLLAARIRTFDGVPGLRAMAQAVPGIFSYEAWGGATFDVPLRFLHECPWDRLESVREAIPDTLLQMLLRASNAVGYTNYPDNVVQRFVKEAAARGVDLFRVFDSLNWVEGMRVACDAVLDSGKILEAAICYTGDIEDPSRSKYALGYYVELAKELKHAGTHILGLKDMAGLLKPFAARILVKALKEETGLPIHLHTHDTSGIQAATLLLAAEVGVDAVDCALSSMSGLTSQVNLNSIAAALRFHERDTGLDQASLGEISRYWEEVRRLYAPFESDMRAGTATVYEHEMPGGQYTNLRVQADSLGLRDRWTDVLRAYRGANQLLGDLIKVTPSSKVVGDLALFMVTNNLSAEALSDRVDEISVPASVHAFLRGDLGQPHGGFPKKLQQAVLKNERPLRGRPGAELPSVDWEQLRAELIKKHGGPVREVDVLSYALYPTVTLGYLSHRRDFHRVERIPTPAFLYGLREEEEIEVEIESGKILYVKLVTISKPDPEGMRTLLFELNGQPRDIRVPDRSLRVEVQRRLKADPDNLHHLGSSMPGRVADVLVSSGDSVARGEPIAVIEAMKMETAVSSPVDGKIAAVHVQKGETVETNDLLVVFV